MSSPSFLKLLVLTLAFAFSFYAPLELLRLIVIYPVFLQFFIPEILVISLGMLWLVYSLKLLVREWREA